MKVWGCEGKMQCVEDLGMAWERRQVKKMRQEARCHGIKWWHCGPGRDDVGGHRDSVAVIEEKNFTQNKRRSGGAVA
ncbi:hypothetical protein Scep_029882 [Stephania cephalantha]|uniref:Uncharacterized protein n=1 Tax=Stephania cephalantha TaxID=152367 RepID=A0AAP0DYK3_9MAGN